MNKRGVILGFGLMIFSAIFFAQPATALSYQNTVGLEFTFNPLLAVTLSSDILLIDGLAPGNSASSNTITITVNTTGLTGYTLSAAVGNGTTYTDNNLTNLASPASPKPTFTSIPTNAAAVASLTSDNTWAYTLDSTNYYGLAYIHSVNNNDETWTVLNATKDVSGTAATSGCVGTCAGTATTNFTISARAAATQPSGDYTNVIQFKVISNPVPSTYSITYNSNTTDTVTNMPTNVATTNTTDSTVTLSSNTPTRAGYTFGGWCTTQVTGNGNCSGNTYAAGANMPIILGSTNNAITLYAIWTVTALNPSACPANSICYAPNANNIIGDMSSLGAIAASPISGVQTTVSGAPSAANINASTTEIELIAPNYARSGYGFAGWSTDFTANNNSTIYGPNETITITAGSLSTNGMILYPVWIESAGDMQEWTGCSGLAAASYNSSTGEVSATLSQITALTDTRDGNVYTIAKLADGQCWMVENLRLNAEHTTSSADIAKAQGYYTYPGSGTNYGSFIGLASSEDTHFDNSSPPATNTIYSSDGSTNIDINSSGDPAYRIPRYNNNNTNMANNATNSYGATIFDSASSYGKNYRWHGYGNYYNWPAAMASTNYYDNYYNANNNEQSNSDSAITSICPKGWQLPLGYQSDGTNRVGGFSYLDMRMGGTGQYQNDSSAPTGTTQSIKWRSFPNNFVNSGLFTSDSGTFRGAAGDYWSRSARSSSESYSTRIARSYIYPGTSRNIKTDGQAVRCIAQ